jgi:hypothetical protein
MPARLRRRLGWIPGTLRVGDAAIAFYPFAWNGVPTEWNRAAVRAVVDRPSRAALGSFVLGVPGALVIEGVGGSKLELAVSEPSRVAELLRTSLAPAPRHTTL